MKPADERDAWIRLFNRLEAAIQHHKHATAGFATDADESLYAATDRIVSDAADRGRIGVRALTGERAPIPRLALTRDEAAAAIGMSVDSFERHVQPTLRLVRLGRMRLIPIHELERWLDDKAARTLEAR